MKNYKKVLAAALAMTMVAGSSVMAAAPGKSYVSADDFEATTSSDATGTINGGGTMEGNVSKDVFKVTVPSSVQGGNAATYDGFNFVMDPQKLITETDAAKYVTGSNITADGFVPGKTLYFVNKSDRQLDNTSDYVKVTNKSSIAVEISLEAQMDLLGSITMSETETFEDDSTSLYLAIIGGSTTKAIDGTNGAEVTGTIAAAKDGAYDIVYDDAAGDYSYKLVRDEEALFSTYEFALTGATNSKGNWLNVTDTPKVELTWKVEPAATTGPSIATTSFTMAKDVPVLIPLNFGSGASAATGIESITYKNSSNADSTLATDNYSITDSNELRIRPSYLNALIEQGVQSRSFTVTFNDTAKTKVTVTLSVAP